MSAQSIPTQKSDRYLLDTVMYLASLASDPKVINPLLDIVRGVTAKLQFGESLQEPDRKQLEHVSFLLKDHLLHRDPVRHFTPAALRQRLAERLGIPGEAPARHRALWDVGLILLALVTSFMLATASTPYLHLEERMLVGLATAMAALSLGVAWMFWSGLRNYSARLQQAYGLICGGFVTTGLGTGLVAVVHAFPELGGGALHDGMFTPVFLLANTLIYLGVRMFALRLGVSSWATSLWAVLGGAVALGSIGILLPHPVQQLETVFALQIAGGLAMWILGAASALLAFAISRRTTKMYAWAMRWFCVTMAVASAGSLLTVGTLLTAGRLQETYLAAVAAGFIITQVPMLISAYAFKRSSGST